MPSEYDTFEADVPTTDTDAEPVALDDDKELSEYINASAPPTRTPIVQSLELKLQKMHIQLSDGFDGCYQPRRGQPSEVEEVILLTRVVS